MHVPDSLATLISQGVVREVVRPLMSGKEAQVYLVVTPDGVQRVAKIYKDAQNRSFKHRSDYTEGRGVRSSRDQRAMNKRSKYGREKDEEAWRSAEVDMIYRLREAGVRVPEPLVFADGVLIMELVQDEDGRPAPRLAEIQLDAARAREVFDHLLREVVRMLCTDVVHGDLSDFNVLMSKNGPVVIDFPQAVDASRNQNARTLLLRDVENLTTFLGQYDPAMRGKPYGAEIWHAYERAELTPDIVLTGTYAPATKKTDMRGVLEEIESASFEEEKRRRIALGLPPLRRDNNRPREDSRNKPASVAAKPVAAKPVVAPAGVANAPVKPGAPVPAAVAANGAPPAKRRRRRRRGGGGGGGGANTGNAPRAAAPVPPARNR